MDQNAPSDSRKCGNTAVEKKGEDWRSVLLTFHQAAELQEYEEYVEQLASSEVSLEDRASAGRMQGGCSLSRSPD